MSQGLKGKKMKIEDRTGKTQSFHDWSIALDADIEKLSESPLLPVVIKAMEENDLRIAVDAIWIKYQNIMTMALQMMETMMSASREQKKRDSKSTSVEFN